MGLMWVIVTADSNSAQQNFERVATGIVPRDLPEPIKYGIRGPCAIFSCHARSAPAVMLAVIRSANRAYSSIIGTIAIMTAVASMATSS
jgi:hypothetical protein